MTGNFKFGYLGNSGIELGELKFKVDREDLGKQILGYYLHGKYPMIGILLEGLKIGNGNTYAIHNIHAYRVLSQELSCIAEDYKLF